MIVYKLFRKKNGKLFPLYVEANREIPIGERLKASVGETVDETHVKSRLGRLSLRPGWHSTRIPFTDWIGKRQPDGTLAQSSDTVWCECEVKGRQRFVPDRYGSRHLIDGWYLFKTNSKQVEPWIISNEIKVLRELTNEEVKTICNAHGIEAQKLAV